MIETTAIKTSAVSIAAATEKAVDKRESNQSKSSGSWSAVFFLLRTVLLDVPLLVVVVSFAASVWLEKFYKGPIITLVDTYRRDGEYDYQGYFPELNSELTYYGRQCGVEDISTTDSNDLVVPPDATSDEAADIMMNHGAVLIKDILSNETASKLREYLETRHEIQDKLPWHEKFWGEIGRLSLGLGVVDHSIVGQALKEVGSHPGLKTTLEGIVGPDPAIVEISTLTTMHGAQPQGIHTDSDYFGSSLLCARSFLHSYTLFMALQDTTSKMGATTVCPGTQWCANEDMEEECMGHGAFEVSSNGMTGKEVGLLHRGSGMMFNQNIWHRGPRNFDKRFPVNRVMFIVTFVSRRELENGDVRQQGLGTYYYMRWNMWGHTFSDLKNAARAMIQPWAALRALGLYKPKSARWGILWFDHAARQLANREDFFADYELDDFLRFLDSNNFPEFLKPDQEHSEMWEPFLRQLLENCRDYLSNVFVWASGIYLGIHGVVAILSTPSRGQPKRFRFVTRYFLTNVTVAALAYGCWYYVQHSFLAERIQTRMKWTPFPDMGDRSVLKNTTVPERMDVLIGSRFDSNFLASFNNFLDYHPGNKRYAEALELFDEGRLAFEFIRTPIHGVAPRFLQQDWTTGYWTVMNENKAIETVENGLLLKGCLWKKRIASFLKQVLANARFGLDRDSVMSKTFAKLFVERWESILFPRPPSTTTRKQVHRAAALTRRTSVVVPSTKTRLVLPKGYFRDTSKGTDAILGTRVWVAMEGRFLQAIVETVVDNDTVEVQYSSGDIDRVGLRQITPYCPLSQGDMVDMATEEFDIIQFEILIAHPLGTYDLQAHFDDYDIATDDDESVLREVPAQMVRHHSPGSSDFERPSINFQVGDRVVAMFQGEGSWFPGSIAEVYTDGTFAVQYDDGDFEDRVTRENIARPQK